MEKSKSFNPFITIIIALAIIISTIAVAKESYFQNQSKIAKEITSGNLTLIQENTSTIKDEKPENINQTYTIKYSKNPEDDELYKENFIIKIDLGDDFVGKEMKTTKKDNSEIFFINNKNEIIKKVDNLETSVTIPKGTHQIWSVCKINEDTKIENKEFKITGILNGKEVDVIQTGKLKSGIGIDVCLVDYKKPLESKNYIKEITENEYNKNNYLKIRAKVCSDKIRDNLNKYPLKAVTANGELSISQTNNSIKNGKKQKYTVNFYGKRYHSGNKRTLKINTTDLEVEKIENFIYKDSSNNKGAIYITGKDKNNMTFIRKRINVNEDFKKNYKEIDLIEISSENENSPVADQINIDIIGDIKTDKNIKTSYNISSEYVVNTEEGETVIDLISLGTKGYEAEGTKPSYSMEKAEDSIQLSFNNIKSSGDFAPESIDIIFTVPDDFLIESANIPYFPNVKVKADEKEVNRDGIKSCKKIEITTYGNGNQIVQNEPLSFKLVPVNKETDTVGKVQLIAKYNFSEVAPIIRTSDSVSLSFIPVSVPAPSETPEDNKEGNKLNNKPNNNGKPNNYKPDFSRIDLKAEEDKDDEEEEEETPLDMVKEKLSNAKKKVKLSSDHLTKQLRNRSNLQLKPVEEEENIATDEHLKPISDENTKPRKEKENIFNFKGKDKNKEKENENKDKKDLKLYIGAGIGLLLILIFLIIRKKKHKNDYPDDFGSNGDIEDNDLNLDSISEYNDFVNSYSDEKGEYHHYEYK